MRFVVTEMPVSWHKPALTIWPEGRQRSKIHIGINVHSLKTCRNCSLNNRTCAPFRGPQTGGRWRGPAGIAQAQGPSAARSRSPQGALSWHPRDESRFRKGDTRLGNTRPWLTLVSQFTGVSFATTLLKTCLIEKLVFRQHLTFAKDSLYTNKKIMLSTQSPGSPKPRVQPPINRSPGDR